MKLLIFVLMYLCVSVLAEFVDGLRKESAV